jgi:predicted RNase H-like HicB family nuclease
MNRRLEHDTDTQMTRGDFEAVKPYAMVIEWSDEDRVFVVTVPDIRGCRTHGATRDEAARMGEEAIAATVASLADRGVPLPAPRFSALDDSIYDSAVGRAE